MIVFQGLRPGNVRSPSGRKQKLFIVHQGLRPWQRSCALRAEREGVHCPPGTASLATFVRPPGGETEVIHCPAGTSSLATLVRPPGGKRRCSLPTRDFVPGNVRAPSGRGNRSCSLPTRDYVPGNARPPSGRGNGSYSLSSRDFVPGNARPPSGRKEKVFIAHQGLRPWQRSCALRAGKQKLFIAHQGLRPWQRSSALRAGKRKLFIVQQGLRPWQRSCALRAEREVVHCPPGTSSLATFVRPAGENRSYSWPTGDFVPGNARAPSGRKHKMFTVRPPGGNRSCWLSTRGTAFLATFARPPGGTERRFRAPAPHQLVIY
jgi:hypothetical protein